MSHQPGPHGEYRFWAGPAQGQEPGATPGDCPLGGLLLEEISVSVFK